MLNPFLKILFIYFLEGKGGRKGEKHQFVVAFCEPPTGDLYRNPGMCPDWEPSLWPFGSQASTQSIELHQPGLVIMLNSSMIILQDRTPGFLCVPTFSCGRNTVPLSNNWLQQ